MRILSRAFLASYLILFAAILSGSILAISVIEVMLHFDDIGARGGGLVTAGRWLATRIPSYYLRDLIPVTSFAAAFLCIALPARRGELTAAMAGGISPLRIALPLLTAAVGLSGAAFVLDETLVLDASRDWKQRPATGDDLLRRGSFWYHTGDRVYNVGGSDPETRSLLDVELYELSPGGRLVRRIHAERARYGDDQRWHLEGVGAVRLDPERETAPPRLEPVGALSAMQLRSGPASDARSLPLPALRAHIAELRAAGRPATRERAQLHARLVDPVSVALFALLAVPLGLAVEGTRSVSAQAVRGGLLVGAYFSARAVASLLALAGVGWAVGAPWLLAALFAAIGALLFARTLRVRRAR